MRGGPRDSDASFASNRPSTASFGNAGAPRQSNISDPSSKQSAIRRINSYLSSHNVPISLSLKPLPSNREISDTLKFILSRFELNSTKVEDDLFVLLKQLNCPHKLNRSALKAPGTPHSFPHVLTVLNWLVQIVDYKDHLSPSLDSEEENPSLYTNLDPVTAHAHSCYMYFMGGDDGAEQSTKSEFKSKIEREKNAWKDKVDSLEKEISELEAKLELSRSGPSPLEAIEEEKQVLEKDKQKFEEFVAKLTDKLKDSQKSLDDKEKELAAALKEKVSICMESEELKKKVETQKIDLWVAERMRREMQAVEREIREAELARTEREEKSWSIDEKINHQLKELDALSIESNQLLKRLKLASDLQYVLNAKGSTVVEVLGIDSKSTIKPAIKSMVDETKKSSMANSEEVLVLQQQVVELNKKIEGKKKHKSELQHIIDETKAWLNSHKKEIENYEARCAAEAEELWKDIEAEIHSLNNKDREANQTLMAAKLKLQETEKQSQDEIQMCAYELAAMIDAVSKHKEHMEGKIVEMRTEISETAELVSEAHKKSLSLQFNMLFSNPRGQELPLDLTTFHQAKKAKNK
ncbi:hypothetical protein V2J09_023485 [Rumex salicifolius]